MNICYSGFIVYEDLSERYRIELCEEPWQVREALVVNHPAIYLDLLEYFEKRYNGFASLVKIIIENDLKYLVGTHRAMNRTLARLKKFYNILTYECIDLKTFCISCHACFSEIFKLIVRDLRRSISALEYFKGEIHRIRDRAHQLVYPYLRDALERLLTINLYYMPLGWDTVDTSLYISCEFDYGRYHDKTDISCELYIYRRLKKVRRVFSLSTADVKTILRKQLKRMKRKNMLNKIEREIMSYLYDEERMLYYDPFFEDIGLNSFIKHVLCGEDNVE